MCNHIMKKVNNLNVCIKCGLTLADNKKIVFDRRLTDYIKKKNRRNGK